MNFKKSNKIPLCLQDELPLRFEKIKNGKYSEEDFSNYAIHEYLKHNDITVQGDGSEIVDFLKGKHVLVTGATGFLGKLLVEKLLRSCDDLKVYVVIREKKGKDMETRLNEMLQSYVFYRLARMRPNFKQNVIGILGDISKPEMSMKPEDRALLINTINIIYHTAATIRFDPPLRAAVNTNVLGTMQVVGLAEECKHLEVFTHVSTAYSNCNRYEIFEEIYKPTLSVEQLLTLNDSFSDKVLDRITLGLLGNMPNVYTLTKQSVEDYLQRRAKIIPMCICRPSIVISCAKEPFRGWGENIFGPLGFIISVGLGFMHVQKGKMSALTDTVPADFVINHCIAASFHTAKQKNPEAVPIFNCTSSSQNPITWGEFTRIASLYSKYVGSMRALCDQYFFMTSSDLVYTVATFVLHTVPAAIIDVGLLCVGKQPMLTKAYEKLAQFGSVLEFFQTNEFKFDNSNTISLWNSLNHVDQKNFNFDFTTISWNSYLATFCLALREVVVQDPLEDTLDQSYTYINRLSYIRKTYLTLWALFCCAIMYFILKLFCYVFQF